MNDYYYTAFYQLMQEARRFYGFEFPEYVENYISTLLADHVEKSDWYPKPSVAENYLTIRTANDAKHLGDECLFLCGVFPFYGQRKGLSTEYYVSIGSTSYKIASQTLHPELFECLSKNFEFASKFINLALRETNYFGKWSG
jgi:hypothetical protein